MKLHQMSPRGMWNMDLWSLDPRSRRFTHCLLVRVSLLGPKGFTCWILLMVRITAHMLQSNRSLFTFNMEELLLQWVLEACALMGTRVIGLGFCINLAQLHDPPLGAFPQYCYQSPPYCLYIRMRSCVLFIPSNVCMASSVYTSPNNFLICCWHYNKRTLAL